MGATQRDRHRAEARQDNHPTNRCLNGVLVLPGKRHHRPGTGLVFVCRRQKDAATGAVTRETFEIVGQDLLRAGQR